MEKKISLIWRTPPEDLEDRIDCCLETALAKVDPAEVKVFFRADDIFAPEEDVARLLEIFAKQRRSPGPGRGAGYDG